MRRTRSSGEAEFIALVEPERIFHQRRRQPELMADQENVRKTVSDYAKPAAGGARSSITQPTIAANNWQIPSHLLTLISNTVQFHGNSHENPNSHLTKFSRVCDTFCINGVSEDARMLRLFPFTLADKASSWLESLPVGSITSWADMQEKFLSKYFPPSKTARLRSLIHAFTQTGGESFYEAWERFKELCNQCPHHGIEEWSLVEKFYNGCNPVTKRLLDTAAGGNMMTSKTPVECLELFEDLAMSSYQDPSGAISAQRGILQVDSNTALTAQVEALSKIVKDLQVKNEKSCEVCRGGHATSDCLVLNAIPSEHVNYINNPNRNNYQNNNYNSGWRNNPGFNWKSQNNNQSLFQNSGQSSDQNSGEKLPSLEDLMTQQSQMMSKFIENTNQRYQSDQIKFKEQDARIQNQGAALQSLERTVGQLAELMQDRKGGALPSSTEQNPKGYIRVVPIKGNSE